MLGENKYDEFISFIASKIEKKFREINNGKNKRSTR